MWTLTEVFKMALYNEVRSQLFYQKAAEITDQDESREWLSCLATMEENHARQIAERIAKDGAAIGFDRFILAAPVIGPKVTSSRLGKCPVQPN